MEKDWYNRPLEVLHNLKRETEFRIYVLHNTEQEILLKPRIVQFSMYILQI